MAFHYQNLIQEDEYKYKEFEQQYANILEYTNKRLRNFRKKNAKPKMIDFWNLAKTSCATNCYLNENKKFTFKRHQEKILIITNILFPDNNYFLETLKNDYNVTMESCYNLKKVLNELDKKDEDFLDSTMEGLVRYHIPAFNAIAADLGLNATNEFIIWKLMEIMYIHPGLFEKVYENKKVL